MIFDEAVSHSISRRTIIKLQTSETSSGTVSYTIPPRAPHSTRKIDPNNKRDRLDKPEFYRIKCKLDCFRKQAFGEEQFESKNCSSKLYAICAGLCAFMIKLLSCVCCVFYAVYREVRFMQHSQSDQPCRNRISNAAKDITQNFHWFPKVLVLFKYHISQIHDL